MCKIPPCILWNDKMLEPQPDKRTFIAITIQRRKKRKTEIGTTVLKTRYLTTCPNWILKNLRESQPSMDSLTISDNSPIYFESSRLRKIQNKASHPKEKKTPERAEKEKGYKIPLAISFQSRDYFLKMHLHESMPSEKKSQETFQITNLK